MGRNRLATDLTISIMSAEIQMSSSTNEVDFPYRALSTSAVASIVFGIVGFIFGIFFWPALSMTAVGAAIGIFALGKIQRYPNEFTGKGVAIAGILLNVLVLVACASMHTYIYVTEVPDGYARVQFYELQKDGSGPDGPTTKAEEIDGDSVFLKGYIHPSSGSGRLKQFILVPDLGTCCFGGQPDSSDMVEVTLQRGQTTKAGMRKKKLAGTFQINQRPKDLSDFDNSIFYRMRVDQIK